MFTKIRRLWASGATAAPSRHSRTGPARPQPASPAPTALYAEDHAYLPTTVPLLRERAAWCRAMADDHDSQATNLIGLASRLRIEAEDFDRLAALAERDDTPEPSAPESAPWQPTLAAPMPTVHFRSDPEFWPLCGARKDATWVTDNPDGGVTCPACLAEMCKDPVPDATWQQAEPSPPMKSTDPDTLHDWRVTHHPVDADPYVHLDAVSMTDAAIEDLAETYGDRATLTYARETPWQDGRRHVVRLDLHARQGDGFFAYERTDAEPQAPRSVADLAGWSDAATTAPMTVVPGGAR